MSEEELKQYSKEFVIKQLVQANDYIEHLQIENNRLKETLEEYGNLKKGEE